MKDIFQNDTPRRAWFQRIIAACLIIGAFLCIYQPEVRMLKEWAKYACSEDENLKLWELYCESDKKTKKPKGARNWTFKNYHFFFEIFL